MSAYSNYLNKLGSMNQQDIATNNLIEMKKEVYENQLRETYEKWGDLALTLHGSSALMKGLHGLYGKYTKKAKEVVDGVKDKVKDADLGDSEVSDALQSKAPVELKDLGTRATREVSQTADLPLERLPTTQAPATPTADVPTIEPTIQAPATEVGAYEPADFTPGSAWRTGLQERVASMKSRFPDMFEPQFEGPVAPRGFGQTPEAVRPHTQAWDQDRVLSQSKAQAIPEEPVEYTPPLEPTYSPMQLAEMRTESAQMRAEALRSSREKGLGEQEPEQTFKYKSVSQGQSEFERGLDTPLSRQYADVKGLERVTPEVEIPSVGTPVESLGLRPPPAMPDLTAEIGRPAPLVERFGGVTETGGARAGGQRGESIMARVMRRVKKPVEAQAEQTETPPQPADAPEPVIRPPSPSTEIRPADDDAVRQTTTGGEEMGGQDVSAPAVAEALGSKVDIPSVSTDLTATATKTAVSTATDTAAEFGVMDAVPVLGEIAALGFGLYDIAEMFKPHHAPAVKRGMGTGLAPPSVEGGAGSGYV